MAVKPPKTKNKDEEPRRRPARPRTGASTGQRVTLADRVRLGEQVAAIKAKTPKKDWAQIVRDAHGRGFTVAGALSGVPDPLKERTRSSLTAEAERTVGTAFQPAERELSHQEARVHALDAKRAADENHFQQWLASQHEAQATRALSADTALAERQAEIQRTTQEGYTAAQAGARTNAAATAGNVSDPQQSTALDISASAKRGNEQVANARMLTASLVNNARASAAGARGVTLALGQQATQRRVSETAAALGKVQEERTSLLDKRAAAAGEEIRRLFGAEVEKADSNRNYLAAAQKLQIGAASDAAKLALDATKAKGADADRDADRAQRAADAAANRRVDQQRITSAAEQARLGRELRARLAERDGPEAEPPSASAITRSVREAAKVGKIASDIRALQRSGSRRPWREVITGRGYSNLEFELAVDIVRRGSLTPVNRRRATTIGILNPEDL